MPTALFRYRVSKDGQLTLGVRAQQLRDAISQIEHLSGALVICGAAPNRTPAA